MSFLFFSSRFLSIFGGDSTIDSTIGSRSVPGADRLPGVDVATYLIRKSVDPPSINSGVLDDRGVSLDVVGVCSVICLGHYHN